MAGKWTKECLAGQLCGCMSRRLLWVEGLRTGFSGPKSGSGFRRRSVRIGRSRRLGLTRSLPMIRQQVAKLSRWRRR